MRLLALLALFPSVCVGGIIPAGTRVIVDEFTRYEGGAVIAPDWSAGTAYPEIRTAFTGTLAIQAPATVEGITFRLDGIGAHPAPVWLENWYAPDVQPATITTSAGMLPYARKLANPDTITFRNCRFVSEVNWGEGSTGFISLMWVNAVRSGYTAKPFRVEFIDCEFTSRVITLFDGHPNYPGLNRQVDVSFTRCRIVSALQWSAGNEPSDPNCAILKSSRGILDMFDCSVSVSRPASGRDVALNAVSVSDGVLAGRLAAQDDDGLSYDVDNGWYAFAFLSNLDASLTPNRAHTRNAILATVAPLRLTSEYFLDVLAGARAAPWIQLTEEAAGRTLPGVSGDSGYTHGTGAGSTVAKRWEDWHP